ncbi:MAG: 5-formyltetrahydrofolate cyclo-ligase [Firmicutes bacterium]|nr:5-formyltetrahydrofolate cyclo-ligase [Bacillota bacterium]
MNKSELRKMIYNSYRDLTDDYKAQADSSIRQNIMSLPEYRDAHTVFCFVGTKDEIDTSQMIDQMIKEGKRVAVPLCTGKGIMEAKKITDRSQLNKGTFGILEPSADAETIPVEEIDFAVVPCVTCNKIGQRLGHGGGFYDRYLEGAEMDCALVCREETMTAAIPTETHDKKFDLIVTERHIFRK